MRVTVVPYDDRWPAFAALRDELAAALVDLGDVRIEHVGSTAVPGLAAKPVLDVDVVVDEARLAPAIAAVAAVDVGAAPGPRDAPRGTDVHVVGGILVADGRVLLGHRSATRRWYADAWDIPGGHVEAGETGRAALERELREELGVGVVAADGLGTARVGDVLIELWVVTGWSGTPTNRAPDEHDELRWFTAADLPVGELAHDTLEPVLRAVLAGTRPPSVAAANARLGP